jgi:hypothetical protein
MTVSREGRSARCDKGKADEGACVGGDGQTIRCFEVPGVVLEIMRAWTEARPWLSEATEEARMTICCFRRRLRCWANWTCTIQYNSVELEHYYLPLGRYL